MVRIVGQRVIDIGAIEAQFGAPAAAEIQGDISTLDANKSLCASSRPRTNGHTCHWHTTRSQIHLLPRNRDRLIVFQCFKAQVSRHPPVTVCMLNYQPLLSNQSLTSPQWVPAASIDRTRSLVRPGRRRFRFSRSSVATGIPVRPTKRSWGPHDVAPAALFLPFSFRETSRAGYMAQLLLPRSCFFAAGQAKQLYSTMKKVVAAKASYHARCRM